MKKRQTLAHVLHWLLDRLPQSIQDKFDSCREVTRLVTEGEDRSLTPAERLRVSLHQSYCVACQSFQGQVTVMRELMQKKRAVARAPTSKEDLTRLNEQIVENLERRSR